MEYEIIGCPANDLIFLFGMRLLPPRAGIIATMLIFVSSVFCLLLHQYLPLTDSITLVITSSTSSFVIPGNIGRDIICS